MSSLLADSLAASSPPAMECPVCDDLAPLICAGCHNIAYCSRECQEAEFHAHKLVCKAFNGMKEAPADGTVRVLHFPVEGKPEFRCLKLKKTATLVELDYEKTTSDLLPEVSVIDHNAISGAPIESPFHIRYSDKPAPINKSILKATDGLSGKKWRGPVLVYFDPEEVAQGIEDVSVTQGRHIDMQAYAHAIAWFSCSGERISTELKGPKVQAVKVLCDGSLPRGEKARFVSVKLPRLHASVRGKGFVSSLSKEIGMPLRFAKAQTPKLTDPRNYLICNMLTNANKHRGLNFEIEKITSGWEPDNHAYGNVHILRNDLQPVTADTLEAFAAFGIHAWVTVTRMKDRPMGMGFTTHDKKAAATINTRGWANFVDEWRQDKVAVLNKVNNEALGNEYDLLESISGVASKGVPWEEGERKEGPVKAIAYAVVDKNA
ncbi:hypothetical protein LTR17_018974 [Elasticomyces elasticus]|nr:hypothetical protein LTR17_018974 [Elasticomyces elasticus]